MLIAAGLIAAGLLMAHFGAHDRLGHWDEHINQWFAKHRGSVWNRISGDFTVLADTLGIAAVAAVVTVLLLVRHWGRLAWLLVPGLAVELSVFLVTNYAVGRPRPHVAHLGSTPSTSSWPSGHVAATAALYGGIAILVIVATSRPLLRLTAWTVAIGLTVCVALSRIYRGEHHATDTVAGLCLGLAALCSAVLIIQTWSSRTKRAPRTGSPPALMGSELVPR
jgi:membrane-associated phospholipid phosphatase